MVCVREGWLEEQNDGVKLEDEVDQVTADSHQFVQIASEECLDLADVLVLEHHPVQEVSKGLEYGKDRFELVCVSFGEETADDVDNIL